MPATALLTDQGQKLWQANFAYVVGAVVVDPAGHVQTVTTAGTSGPGPAPTFSDAGGTTSDNTVTWTDGGGWLPNHPYAVGNTVGDAAQHLQEVTTAGISGPASAPTFSDGGGTTPDNAVVWTDNGTWMASHAYVVGNLAGDTSHFLQKVTAPGISGPGCPGSA